MKISELSVGKRVTCPKEIGNPSYEGIIQNFSNDVHTNSSGVEFVWVIVRKIAHPQTSHVWAPCSLS